MFSLHTKQEEFKKIFGYFGFLFEENSVQEDMIIAKPSSLKTLVSKCFSSKLNSKTGVFKFHRFEERFRKALFRWLILWTMGLNGERELCTLIAWRSLALSCLTSYLTSITFGYVRIFRQVRRSLTMRKDFESAREQRTERRRISSDAQVAKRFCTVSTAFLLS